MNTEVRRPNIKILLLKKRSAGKYNKKYTLKSLLFFVDK
jgi:hypothetical protein